MFVAGRITRLIKRYCSLIGRRETECADCHLTALLLICRPPPPPSTYISLSPPGRTLEYCDQTTQLLHFISQSLKLSIIIGPIVEVVRKKFIRHETTKLLDHIMGSVANNVCDAGRQGQRMTLYSSALYKFTTTAQALRHPAAEATGILQHNKN
ncbi:unnamed protein product [Danaus chrysippus]|uniref:(African queen) hypothetical protein n=1 Tax=Danaus chrysippus TaxID=151541 RepID=A0A8J2QQP6_9NEOP|nr:unnamed protein product [Danaus chrysippus]